MSEDLTARIRALKERASQEPVSAPAASRHEPAEPVAVRTDVLAKLRTLGIGSPEYALLKADLTDEELRLHLKSRGRIQHRG